MILKAETADEVRISSLEILGLARSELTALYHAYLQADAVRA